MKKIRFTGFILVFLSILLISHNKSYAASPANYGFTRITNMDVLDDTGFLDNFGYIYFYDKSGNIWYGKTMNLFYFLKADNGAVMNPYIGTSWSNVSKGADSMDAISFYSEVLRHQFSTVRIIQNAAYNILSFSDLEREFVMQFYPSMQPLVVVFLCIYGIIAFILLVENNRLQRNEILRQLFIFLFVVYICRDFERIMGFFYNFANYFTAWVQDTFNPFTQIGNSLVWKYDDLVDLAMVSDQNTLWNSWDTMLEALFYLIIGNTLFTITGLVALVLFYSIHLVLGMRICLLPFAIPSCIVDWRYSPGMQYIKHMIAECMQGGIYLLVITVAGWAESVTYASMPGDQVGSLIMPFVLIVALTGSKIITNEIVESII